MERETIVLLPHEQLEPSPSNPRSEMRAAELEELAQSIRVHGVLQPVVVRPRPEDAPSFAGEPAPYQIVFGHRRVAAAHRAGLERVPCIVRAMTDQAVALAQLVENSQREGVGALDEAAAYVRLRDEHELSPEQIAERIGRSRSHVYGRLKIAAAGEAVHEALREQGLPAEIALEVARLRGAELQRTGLQRVRRGDGWCSLREAQQLLRHLFQHDITAAPFDVADAALVPEAGRCGDCPKLAANDPDLAALPAGTCTDPACWRRKLEAHTARHAGLLRESGKRVLEGKEAEDLMIRGTPVRDVILFDADGNELRLADRLQALGSKAPATAWVLNPRTGLLLEYIHDDDLEAIERELAAARAGRDGVRPGRPGRAAAQPDEDATADWTPAELATREPAWNTRVVPAVVRRAVAQPRTVDELRMMLTEWLDTTMDDEELGIAGEALGLLSRQEAAQTVAEEAGQEFDAAAWRAEQVARYLGPDELAAWLVGLVLQRELESGPWGISRPRAQHRVALATRYGVDPVALLEEAHAAADAGAAAEEAAA